MMSVPVMAMLSVWGVLVAISAAIFLYRSSLTRDEDDQIYLDEAFAHEKAAQEAIVARVNKIEPALHLSVWMAGAATVVVVVYYVVNMIQQFR